MSELSKFGLYFEEEAVVVSTIGFAEVINNYDEVLEYFIKPDVFWSQPTKTILTIWKVIPNIQFKTEISQETFLSKSISFK